ncbi:MAG: metallophosphoesterase [Clostridia bacterium]|nr:metallophosphoesterase [Clostridia bacterium]
MKRIYRALAALIALALLVLCAADSRLHIVQYTVDVPQVETPLRIAFVADLHSCLYGENQTQLTQAVLAQEPDLLLLGGDIFDEEMPHENALCFIRQIAPEIPCYFVTGNHEFWSDDATLLKRQLREIGVTVLEGDCAPVGETGLQIVGVDDPTSSGQGCVYEQGMLDQLRRGFAQADPEQYTILLAHRPELIETYLQYDVGLVLSGHAHGGQFRLPGLVNGLWAPNQGWLPRYAAGQYRLDETDLIVSRGLARETTRLPRIFNRPELVIVDIR